MKKYIFSAIFFFLTTALALWGFDVFSTETKTKSVAAEVGKAATPSLTQTSGSEKVTDSTEIKENLDSEAFVGPVLPKDDVKASLCNGCQISDGLPFIEFPSFHSFTNSAKSFLDNVFECRPCGGMIESEADSVEEQEAKDVENIEQ